MGWGVGEMREMAEYLPNTHEDLSLESQNPGKKRKVHWCAWNPHTGRAETDKPLKLIGQPA